MPKFIDRDQVQKLMDEGAQIVEVLPPEEYEDEHLPGAINIPLTEIGDKAVRLLSKDRPVVVYCWDYQ